MTEQNLLEFSNNKVYSSRNMSLMGKKEKKIISEKSLIKKVRNEQKYKLKVKWNIKVSNYNWNAQLLVIFSLNSTFKNKCHIVTFKLSRSSCCYWGHITSSPWYLCYFTLYIFLGPCEMAFAGSDLMPGELLRLVHHFLFKEFSTCQGHSHFQWWQFPIVTKFLLWLWTGR